MNISVYCLAKELNVSETRISEIIHGSRSITADTAIRFSKCFGTTAEFWEYCTPMRCVGVVDLKNQLRYCTQMRAPSTIR